MRHRIPMIFAAIAMLFCTTIVFAQAPQAPPKPGPEVKAMGAMGKVTSTGLMSFDPEAKNYIYSEVSSTGEAFTVRGVNTGDTWVFDNDATMQGKPMHGRFTVKYTSKNACEIKYEAGPDANSLQVIMTGKETKKAAAPAPAKPTSK